MFLFDEKMNPGPAAAAAAPLISVIVPVYNAAGTLRRAVDSVMQQTFGDFELILVDDGSKDAGSVMCDNYASVWPDRIRILHKENGGLMRAWTDGVRISRGQYLCFMDSDDWIDPDMLEKLCAKLARDEEDRPLPGQIICCGYVIEYGSGRTRTVRHGLPEGIYEEKPLETELKQELLGHEHRRVILSRCMKLTDRKLIEDNLSFLNPEIRMGEDVNIMVPALLDASRVVLMNDPCYHYVFAQDSMAHGYDATLHEQNNMLREQLRVILKNKKIPSDERSREDRIRCEYLFLFLYTLKNAIRSVDKPNAAGKAVQRIKELCRLEDSRQLILSCSDPMEDRSFRLLAIVCRKPDAFHIRLVRTVFRLYDLLQQRNP